MQFFFQQLIALNIFVIVTFGWFVASFHYLPLQEILQKTDTEGGSSSSSDDNFSEILSSSLTTDYDYDDNNTTTTTTTTTPTSDLLQLLLD